jgi:hypothetical protein
VTETRTVGASLVTVTLRGSAFVGAVLGETPPRASPLAGGALCLAGVGLARRR